MADSEVVNLTNNAAPASGLLVYLTDGSLDYKATLANLAASAAFSGLYQPLDADLTALAAAGNSTVLGATTASFLTADETKLDGIETGATADQSAAELLTAVKTVDGSGSGLDADLLRGTTPSTAGLALLDDADAAAQRSTLGVNDLAAGTNLTLVSAAGVSTLSTDSTFAAKAIATKARATSDQSVLNSTTLVNDNALQLAVSASCEYVVDVFLIYDAAGSGAAGTDFKAAFACAGASSLDWGGVGITSAASSALGANTYDAKSLSGTMTLGGIGVGSSLMARLSGYLIVSTDSTLYFQFAQAVIDAANNTTRKAGSVMILRRVV